MAAAGGISAAETSSRAPDWTDLQAEFGNVTVQLLS
jgi:hypothetical protein